MKINYDDYKNTRNMLKRYQKMQESGEDYKEIISSIEVIIKEIEHNYEHIKEFYENEYAIQKSFTPQQIDFICHQIGEWYLEWKGHIVSKESPGCHRLGVAKEQLKTMICGE